MARLPPHVYRRRRAVALAAIAAVVVLAISGVRGLGEERTRQRVSAAQTPAPTATPPAPPELPRGGRRLLPDHRIVAYYGAPQSDELGALGIGTPAQAVARLNRQARAYGRRSRRPVLPALELIASVAAAHPGADGAYRMRQPAGVIRRYLRAARRARALLILDVQPGRSDFLTEAQALERWLREPDVGLAIDPEWRMTADQTPGQVIGSVTAEEVNRTTAWLAELSRREQLPQKLFLIHQFTFDMIQGRRRLEPRAELAMVLNADGFGTPEAKISKYDAFVRDRRFFPGFKLFYREDTRLMSPRDVLRLRPRPAVVIYE